MTPTKTIFQRLQSPVVVAIVVCLLMVGLGVCVRGCAGGIDRGRGGDDHREVVPHVEGGRLVFVSDRQFPTVDQVLLVRDMESVAAARGFDEGFVWLDDSEPEGQKAIAIAAKSNVTPPLVAIVKDRRVVRVTRWPATLNELEAWLKK